MSDHNFEKQVQQKLDELKIPPADNVWSSIEGRIQKDKRRRRGLLLLPFLLLLVGGAFYFIAIQTGGVDNKLVQKSSSTKKTDYKDNSTSEQPTVTKEKYSESKTDENSSLVKPQPGETLAAQPGVKESTKDEKGKDDITGNINSAVREEPSAFNKRSVAKTAKESEQSITQDIAVSSRENKDGSIVDNKQLGKRRAPVTDKAPDENLPQDELGDIKKDDIKQAVPARDSALAKNNTTNTPPVDVDTSHSNQIAQKNADSSSATTKADNLQQAASKMRLSSKFRWGAKLSIGASNAVEGGILEGGLLGGIIGEEKALVADVAYNANTNNSPGNTPPPVSYKPSAIESGVGFSVGAFVQKGVSRRFSLSTGLQYRFYSTHIRVGNRVDSNLSLQNAFGSTSVSRYYMSAPVTTTYKYTNRFHFLELPLTAHLQLNKGNKIPILLNGGFSLMYLVATNALHFDSRTGVYYRDNSLFNKWQANLSTGLAISVRNKSVMPIHIGPEFQWGLTSLLKDDVSDKKKLSYFGLGAKVFLNK